MILTIPKRKDIQQKGEILRENKKGKKEEEGTVKRKENKSK